MTRYLLQALPTEAASKTKSKFNEIQTLAEIEIGAHSAKPLILAAKPNLIYRLVDPVTGAVVKGQKIYSKGRNLQVDLDGVTIVELTDFFSLKSEIAEPAKQEASSSTSVESPSNLTDASSFDCNYTVIHSQIAKASPNEARSMLWQSGQSAADCVNFAGSAVPEAAEVGALSAVLGIGGAVGAAAAGVVTAAAVSGGSSGAASLIAATIKGGIYAGPVTSTGNGDLTVEAFDSSGHSLGSTKAASDGTYSLTLNSGYRGAVVLKAYDVNTFNSSDPKYMDEATKLATTIPTLMAVANVTDASLIVNITGLTNVAAVQAGASTGGSTVVPDATSIDAANAAVSNQYLGGINVLTSSVIPVVNADGSVNTAANAYGAALSALSWFEKEQGLSSSQAAIELNASTSTDSSGTRVLVGTVKSYFIDAIYSAQTDGQITSSQAVVLLKNSTGLTSFPAVILGATSGAVTEDSATTTATGTLTASDVDNTANTFQVVSTATASKSGYGTYTMTEAGVWTYTLDNSKTAVNALNVGQRLSDSFKVKTADGTEQSVTVTINGANDAAVVAGATSGALTETNDIQSAGGTLTSTDVDGTANLFIAQSNLAGGNGYGKFSITTAGVWTYTMNTAHDEFVAGTTYSDKATVSAADGTTQVLTVTMTGRNDAAVIKVTSTASLAEADSPALLSTTGSLSATDVDSNAAFFAQTGVVGNNGYGQFSIDTNGAWTYTANSAHNEFVGGQTYTDSFTVATADGTSQVITVRMTGTNDPAVITGASTANLTETDSAASLSTTGSLSATDIDSSAIFVAQTAVAGSNGYGQFSIGINGVWTYTANSAHNEFVGEQTYTDSFTVATADGTSQVIAVSMTGANDAAVISGTTAGALKQTNAAESTGGKLTSTDVDGTANLFTAQSNVAGGNGYGKFGITTAGVWTYTMDSAHNEFVDRSTYTDTATVSAADGTTQVLTVTMTGTNDEAVILGATSGALTEDSATTTATGTLTASDVDNTANTFQAVSTATASAGGYGTYTMTEAGVWTYTLDNSKTAVNALNAGQRLSDSFKVKTADGTEQFVTVTINGANDTPTLTVGNQSVQLIEAGGLNNTTTGTSAATITLTKADVDGSATYDSSALTSTYGWATTDSGATFTRTGTYGRATLNTSTGLVSYALDNTLLTTQALTAAQGATDSFTVQVTDGNLTADGVVNFSITGSNDSAVISGQDKFNLTETTVALTQSGKFTSADVDGTVDSFTAETLTGSYGSVVMSANGQWTYTASSAHSEFVSGTTYTDTFNIHAADGTAHALTINIAGTSTPTAPALSDTQTLDNVTNLGVDSALVLAFDQSITLKSGHIKIFDDMDTAGWVHRNTKANESIQDIYNNDVDITLVNGVVSSVFIGGVDYTSRFNLSTSVQAVGNNLVIDLKQSVPSNAGSSTVGGVTTLFSTAFDWDFGSNYHVNFDAGIVQNSDGTSNYALSDSTTLNFTTVTPVDTTASATSSLVMDSTGVSTALSSGYKWLNGNQSKYDGSNPAVSLDLTGGKYAVVIDSNGGITKTTNLSGFVNLDNFNATDILYNDNHGDMSLSTTDGLSAAQQWQSGTTNFGSGYTRVLQGPTQQLINFSSSSYPLAWTAVSADSFFENQTHYNANVIIFG